MRRVLVTGASSGIGAAVTRALAARGMTVYAGVRDDPALAAAAAVGPTCIPLRLDVTDPAQIAAAAAQIAAAGGLDGLVSNAGIVISGPLEALPLDAIREGFEVNVFGALALIGAMLPMLRAAHGRLVLMSSIAGRNAAPFIGPYAASKHALEAFGDALRGELRGSVEVALIEPGAVKTPIWERSAARGRRMIDGMSDEHRDLYAADIAMLLRASASIGAHGIAPANVVDAVVHALTAARPKTRYVVGNEAKLQLFARRFLPDRLRDRLVRSVLRRAAR